MITIINYGAGNIKSIQNMLRRIGQQCIITNEAEVIDQAEKIILPGVGAFDYGMGQLKESNLIEVLNKKANQDKVPVLGICLGAQMLGNKSEEGIEPGLGWIDMNIVKFDVNKMDGSLKVPHMSWNEIQVKKPTELMEGLDKDSRFYFVHSYHMQANNKSDILAETTYGYSFTSAIQQNNIYGVQFHPEKSHKFGMKLLQNFSNL